MQWIEWPSSSHIPSPTHIFHRASRTALHCKVFTYCTTCVFSLHSPSVYVWSAIFGAELQSACSVSFSQSHRRTAETTARHLQIPPNGGSFYCQEQTIPVRLLAESERERERALVQVCLFHTVTTLNPLSPLYFYYCRKMGSLLYSAVHKITSFLWGLIASTLF